MAKFRLPDLRIKVELARALAVCTQPGLLSGRHLSACMSPGGGADDVFSDNKRMGGILLCDDVRLRNLAHALEVMVTEPVTGGFVDRVVARIGKIKTAHLYPDAILGTYQEFAQAILRLRGDRTSVDLLATIVRGALAFEAPRDRLDVLPLEVEGTRDTLTPLSQRGRERIVYQPDRAGPFLQPRTPVQFQVPGRKTPQLVFAFEHRDDAALIEEPWGVSGAWLGARYQEADAPARLLGAGTLVEPVKGMFQVQAVGIDLRSGLQAPAVREARDLDEGLMSGLVKRLKDVPKTWDPGYAKAMVLLTVVPRLKGARLYRGAYGVRVDA